MLNFPLVKKLLFTIIISSLMILSCNDSRPYPKTGEVVYDIPFLLWKDIDEVVKVLGDSNFKINDSIAKVEQFRQREYFSKHPKEAGSKWNDSYKMQAHEISTFSKTKDGWKISFEYELSSRKINCIDLYTNSETNSYQRFDYNKFNELLLIGNLSLTEPEKYEVWFVNYDGLGTTETTYPNPAQEHSSFTSLKVCRPGMYTPHNR